MKVTGSNEKAGFLQTLFASGPWKPGIDGQSNNYYGTKEIFVAGTFKKF